MPKTKTKRSQKHVHKKFVSGVLAALAFTIVIGSQLGNVQDPGQLAAVIICWDGEHEDGYICTPPPAGDSTQPPPGGDGPCPALNGQPASPDACAAVETRKQACQYPSTWDGNNGGVCNAAAPAAGDPNAGTAGTGTCPTATPFWGSNTQRCYTTVAEKDAAEMAQTSAGTQAGQNACPTATPYRWTNGSCNATAEGGQQGSTSTCTADQISKLGDGCHDMGNGKFNGGMTMYIPTGSTTVQNCATTWVAGCTGSGTNNYSGTADTIGACTDPARGGTWDAASSTCSVPPGGSGTQNGQYVPPYSDQYNTGQMSAAEMQAQCVVAKGTWKAAVPPATNGWCDMAGSQTYGTQPYGTQPYGTQPYVDPFKQYGPQPYGPAPVDFSATNYNDLYKAPGTGPGFNFDYDNAFKDYQVDYDDYDTTKQFGATDVKRLQREGGNASREVEQMKEELKRVVKRTAGATSCPAIAKAQAAVSAVEGAVRLMTSATSETAGKADSVQQQLYGSGYGDQGLMGKAHMAVGSANICEGFSFMQKDIQREVAQWEKELKRISDVQVKAEAEAIIAKMRALDPAALADFSCMDNPPTETFGGGFGAPSGGFGPPTGGFSGGFGPPPANFCNPMRSVFDQMEKLRWEFGDLMGSQRSAREEHGVCGNLEGIRAFLSDQVGSGSAIPEDLMKKASGHLSTGIKACKAGEIDTAARSLAGLEGLKHDFESYIDIPEDEGEDNAFAKLDPKSLMRDSFQSDDFAEGFDMDAFLSKLEERILSQMKTAVQVMYDELAKGLTATLARLESKVAEAIAATTAAVTDNIMIGFSGELKDEILERKTDLANVVLELDSTIARHEDDLSRSTEDTLEKIYEYANVRNWSEDSTETVRKEIDAFTTAVAGAEDDTEAKQIIEDESAQLLAKLEAWYDADKDAQYEDGTLAFSDLHGKEDVWYAGWASAAKEACVLNGEANADKTRSVNAERATNIAEGLTMLARNHVGCEGTMPAEIDLSNPVVARMPEWAQPSATYLAKEGVDLEGIVGTKQAAESMTRGEMMEAASATFHLSGDIATATAFKDSAGASTDVLTAAAGLIEAGVVGGETMADGSKLLNLDGDLNRAAFSKIMVGVGTINETSITGPQTIGGVESYDAGEAARKADEALTIPTI